MSDKKYLPSAIVLYLNYFLHGIGCSVLGQVAIKEALSASWGVEVMAITAISAALGLGRLIALPFAGPLSDKFGRRFSTAVGGFAYAVYLIGLALAFNAGAGSGYRIAYICAIVGGIANSFLDTGIYPAVAEIIKDAPGVATMGIKFAISGSQLLLPFFLGITVGTTASGMVSYNTLFYAPGLFEQTHHLSEIQNALIYYMEYEDEMHDLIKYIVDFELELAESACAKLHPEALFHHDDWGSETNSFFRPSVFEDFFLEPYQQIYGYYKSHGCEFVFHHSDSYGANIVPIMIEMGIDVWQGCMHSNNVPELVKKYGDKITFMGEIDNKFVDFDGWTIEDCEEAALDAINSVGSLTGFIPCITQGGPGSVYPGTYRIIWETIDKYNIEHFGCTQEELDANRPPRVVMFGAEEKEPPRHRA